MQLMQQTLSSVNLIDAAANCGRHWKEAAMYSATVSHGFQLAEKAEAHIDEARTALWAARSFLALLEENPDATNNQAERVHFVLSSVEGALGHLTHDVEERCYGEPQSTADEVSEMVRAFPRYNAEEAHGDEEGAQ